MMGGRQSLSVLAERNVFCRVHRSPDVFRLPVKKELMQAHNGCARFGGDEWNTERRYSIQPRALLQRRVEFSRKRLRPASD